MEQRRLISFGTSSYVISLPRSWVVKNNLSKGDFIYFYENGNGEIIITPQQKEITKESKTVFINATKKSITELNREIISNYIAGYDVIKIQGPSLKYQSSLRDIVRDFTTMDIIEQTKSSVVAKDFLNIEKISLDDLTRRIDLILRSMMEDTKHYNNKATLEKVYTMDIEVNRITFMTFRFIRKALNDPALAKLFKLTPENLLGLWLLVSRLEKVADEVKRIAKLFKSTNFSKDEIEEILYVYNLLEKEYLNVIKSYYHKDRELAFNIASNKDKIIDICSKIAEKSSKVAIGSLIEKLKSIEVYIAYIARAVHEETT